MMRIYLKHCRSDLMLMAGAGEQEELSVKYLRLGAF
jgi:hypothetical protein